MSDRPKTLEEFRAHRDWVELGPNEVPRQRDVCIIPNEWYRTRPAYLQNHSNGLWKTVAQRRATHGVLTADISYFRHTLGTQANPFRPEHFVNGVEPTHASILADYENRHYPKD